MFSYIYRHNAITNYCFNRIRFKQLKLGKNVVINMCKNSRFSYGKGAWLAEGTRLDIFNSQLTLYDGVNICKHASIIPSKSGIKIGNRSKLQEYGRLIGEITIGDDVIIAPNFYMSSGIHVFNKEPYLLVALQDYRHDHFGEPCIIEDDCWIGINVCIMPGVRIRRGTIIGAGAVVTHSTEPYAIYGGIPAKKIGIRLSLEPKNFIDANRVEDLPYFYQGFDHYNYHNNKNQYQGILTNNLSFSLYTELPAINSIQFELESLTPHSNYINHNNIIHNLNPGKNLITINDVKINDKLICFQSKDKLIAKKVIFI